MYLIENHSRTQNQTENGDGRLKAHVFSMSSVVFRCSVSTRRPTRPLLSLCVHTRAKVIVRAKMLWDKTMLKGGLSVYCDVEAWIQPQMIT